MNFHTAMPSAGVERLHRFLPTVTAWQAEAARTVCDSRVLAMLPDRHRLQVQPGPAPRATDMPGLRLALQCSRGELVVELVLSDGDALGLAFDESLPEDAQALLIDIALEPVRAHLDKLGLQGLQVHSATRLRDGDPPQPTHDHALHLRWQLDDGHARTIAWLHADTAVLASLQAAAWQLYRPPALPCDWTMPARLLLGQRRLPLALIETLTVGDVLALDGQTSAGSALDVQWVFGHARGRCWQASAQAEGHRLTISGATSVIDKRAEGADAAPALSDAGLAMGEVEIPVNFEIDTVALPLADLASIRPGYVLELPMPARLATVRLVAYGQAIGHGELVAVGEQLGVRITRMAATHAADIGHQ
jgi:type III secretion protein Q